MISLKRVGLVARRDFLVTVSNKGFLFGVLIMPLIMGLVISLLPKLMSSSGPQVSVEVALIDGSAAVGEVLRQELDTRQLQAAQAARNARVAEALGPAGDRAAAAVEAAQPQIPQFSLTVLPGEESLDDRKVWTVENLPGKYDRRALVVIPTTALAPRGGLEDDAYKLFAPRNLPQEAESMLHGAVRQALVTARLEATGVDPALVRDATRVAQSSTVVLGAGGKQEGAQGLNRALPFIMGLLLFMGVMMGGQSLMTSTVEEKSSRVVEVLLAAVSPLELMWGKLLGQLGVGLVAMGVYVALGVLALLQFAMIGLIDPKLIVFLFLFFLMAYLVYGAMMQTIGAAVNQMADAQSLMGPVMMLLMIPYILNIFIGGKPDALFSVVLSFLPPVNAFAMMARLASSSPPPVWQVLLSLAGSLVAAVATVWFAAKVFRVGLLMHGKPPSFGTLVKWARMS